jgi:hypothetical protein
VSLKSPTVSKVTGTREFKIDCLEVFNSSFPLLATKKELFLVEQEIG